MEGGCKARLESDWSLADAEMMRRYWRECAPPAHISNVAIAAGLGVDLLKRDEGGGEPSDEEHPFPAHGPSIAELSKMVSQPVGDTLGSSLEALAILNGGVE